MKKEKLKSPPQTYGCAFLGLWSASYTTLWALSLSWSFITDNDSAIKGPSVEMSGIIGLLAVTNLVALMQQRLLQRSIRGWVVSSVIGTIITLMLSSALVGANDPTMLLRSLALLVPASVVQALWLRQRVKSAWLWPLANIVAAMSFALISRSPGSPGIPGMIVIGLLHGIIQSIVMRYLWTHPQEAKNETPSIDVEELAHQQAEVLAYQQAVERLNPYETPENTPPIETDSVEEALQQEKSR